MVQRRVTEVVSVETFQKEIRYEKVQRRRQEEVAEKRNKWIGNVSVYGDQKILGVPDGTHGAPDGNGKRQSEKEKFGGDGVPPREIENDRRPYNRHGVVHEDRRQGTHAEEDKKDELIYRFYPPEKLE